MEQIYNKKMNELGYGQFVCDIFLNWEDVKDEILLPDRKEGSGNGTVHVFLGAADECLKKEFPGYYKAVTDGEDPSVGAIKITHYFVKSNVLSMLGYVCDYYKKKDVYFLDTVINILTDMDNAKQEDGLLSTSSLLKLSIGSNKLRPYFKQFDSKGIFHQVIRQLLLPNSAYKIALYKNTNDEYAAFWLIGFGDLDDFMADVNKDKIEKPLNELKKCEKSLQQIFYGAPGTGKSHAINELTAGKDVIRTTFHPDTDYSTFVGAYKPTTKSVPVTTVIGTEAVPVKDKDGKEMKEDKIVYEFVSQAFLQAYVEAWRKYSAAPENEEPLDEYLVIEEINRGNCAQIFGDLFQLLDRGDEGFSEYPIKADSDMKKLLGKAFAGLEIKNKESINALFKGGKDIVAQVLAGDVLLLPSNFYIWATMNTSDQSLFPIDSAFKRRWDWYYVPISNAGKNWVIEVNGAKYDWWKFLEAINDKVYHATYSEDKKLGYFFCKANDGVISADKFVSKVIFYLWNDVFKDYGFDDKDFQDEEGKILSFDRFYQDINGVTNVNVDNVELFLENLGVEEYISEEEDSDDSYEKESDLELNNNTNSNQRSYDKTKYRVNGSSELLRKGETALAVIEYLVNNKKETYSEILTDIINFINSKTDRIVIKVEDYPQWKEKHKNDKGKRWYDDYPLTTIDNVKFYFTTQWGKDNIDPIIELAKSKGCTVESVK